MDRPKPIGMEPLRKQPDLKFPDTVRIVTLLLGLVHFGGL